jgi:mannose-1-phosphate guanylyltransferase
MGSAEHKDRKKMSSKKLNIVIMCGGSGTRFWPASRQSTPKQFLRLNNQTSLLQDTVARLEGLVPPKQIFLLAAVEHEENLRRHVPDIPRENYILEPAPRNTGPALALAARKLETVSASGVLAALPADHAIKDDKTFRRTIQQAASYAAGSRSIVTIGIEPDSPETGYGYIELGEQITEGVRSVIQFVEKPRLEKALEYLNSGRYVWNAGIFVVRVDVLADSFKQYEPTLYKALWEKVPAPGSAGHDSKLRDVYPGLPKTSIDYAVMEHAQEIACVPANFEWNDLGSWSALEKYWEKDRYGNVSSGRYYSINSTGNIIASAGRDIALIGVEDLIVVERNDAVLICAKERSQDVKKLTELLKKEEREDLL